MEVVGQTILLRICLGVYACHMVSIVFWFSSAVLELRRQRGMKREGAAARPTGLEYWVVRLFLCYVITDAIRGADGMFDNPHDGTVRSIWGMTPMGVRLFSWWLRDACLFLSLAYIHEFNLGWAQIVLDRSSRKLIAFLRGSSFLAIAGLAVCFYNLVATNRQTWQIYAALVLFPVNAVSAIVCARIFWDLMPQIKDLRLRSDDQALEAIATRTQTVSGLIMFVNVVILTVFPVLCVQKILHQSSSSPLVPNQGVDSWIGGACLPMITNLPHESPSTMPSPALEIVEVMIGWFALCTWWPTQGYRMVSQGQKGGDSFASHVAIGLDLRENMVAERRESGDEIYAAHSGHLKGE